MKKKSLIIIILVIIAGTILFLTQKEDKTDAIKKNFILKNIDFDKIDSIYIKNYVSKGFTLKQDEKGNWSVLKKKKKCNKFRIEYLVNILKDTDFNNVISNKKERYKNFNVDDKNAIKVILKIDGKPLKLWIGKFTPDGNGCYVRLENGNVYIVTKNLTYEFDKKQKYFYLENDNKTKTKSVK